MFSYQEYMQSTWRWQVHRTEVTEYRFIHYEKRETTDRVFLIGPTRLHTNNPERLLPK